MRSNKKIHLVNVLVRNYDRNVMQYCGRVVQEIVHNMRTNTGTFAHNPLRIVCSFLNTFLCTLNTHSIHQVVHTFFMQYQSVNYVLYAKSTGLTITTTYNK